MANKNYEHFNVVLHYDNFSILSFHDIKEAFLDDGDIDLYVKYKDRKYWGTASTISSIKKQMAKNSESWFWSTNCFIVETMTQECIANAIKEMIEDESLGLDGILYLVPISEEDEV